MLTDIEDRALAMAEGDYVDFKTARPVLGTFYERNVSFNELSSIVGHLANLGYVCWRVKGRKTYYFRLRASINEQHSCTAFFTATPSGVSYLKLPRIVAQQVVQPLAR